MNDEKMIDLTPQDLEKLRDEWIRKFISVNLPEETDNPEFEIYRKMREAFLTFPPLNQCERRTTKFSNEIGQDFHITYAKEAEIALLASMFDNLLALTPRGVEEKINQIKQSNNDADSNAEIYAKGVSEDYQYNMALCLDYALKEFEANQVNWMMSFWWFASWGLAVKTIQALRSNLRWYENPSLARMRNFLLLTGQRRVEEMLGKTPTGPVPDYLGFLLKLLRAGDSLWARKDNLTQERLAEEMGISVDTLKENLKRYGFKWRDIVNSYKQKLSQ